jgi:hypothetical protein
MKSCPLRLDTPPEYLSEHLLEHGSTTQDLLAWWDALLAALLDAGGWEMLPEALLDEDNSLSALEWEFGLPKDA